MSKLNPPQILGKTLTFNDSYIHIIPGFLVVFSFLTGFHWFHRDDLDSRHSLYIYIYIYVETVCTFARVALSQSPSKPFAIREPWGIHFLPLEEIHPPNFLSSRKLTCFDTRKISTPQKLKCPKCQPFQRSLSQLQRVFCLFFLPETNSFAT